MVSFYSLFKFLRSFLLESGEDIRTGEYVGVYCWRWQKTCIVVKCHEFFRCEIRLLYSHTRPAPPTTELYKYTESTNRQADDNIIQPCPRHQADGGILRTN